MSFSSFLIRKKPKWPKLTKKKPKLPQQTNQQAPTPPLNEQLSQTNTPRPRYEYKLPENLQPQPTVEEQLQPPQPIKPMGIQQPQQFPQSQFSLEDQLKEKQDSGAFKQDFLGGLNPDLGGKIQKNIQDFASGDAMEATKSVQNQALATQIRNMRSTVGGKLAGQIGQGGALAGSQKLEQGILGQMAQKGLQEQQQEVAMRKTGTQMGIQLAQQQQMAKQFGETLEADYAKQTLSEKMAADQNHLQQQGIDLEEAKMQGYTDENGNHVKGTMELNTEKFGLEKDMYADDQAWKAINLAIDAGDYVGANVSAKNAGIPTIDWTNVQEQKQMQKVSTGINDIENMLANVDPNQNPQMYDSLIKQYGKLYGQKQKLLGLPFDQEDLDNMLSGIGTGNLDQNSAASFNNFLNNSVVDWWENGIGKNMGMMLEGDAANWYAQIADLSISDNDAAAAAKNLSQVIWSAYAAENGYALSDKQTQLLKSAGIAPSADKEVAEMEEQEKIDAYYNGLKPHGELKGALDPNHELNDVYNEINNMATDWVKSSGWENKSGAGNNGYYFTSAPTRGSYIKHNGKLYKVISDSALRKVPGKDYEAFDMQNLDTGEMVTIKARGDDVYHGGVKTTVKKETSKQKKKKQNGGVKTTVKQNGGVKTTVKQKKKKHPR